MGRRHQLTALLDTHTLLWALGDPSRLGPSWLGVICDTANEPRVSAATAWEPAIRHRLGRRPEAGLLLGQHHRHLTRFGTRTADVTADHTLLAGRLAGAHRDRFDRMLAAQTLTKGWVLVTKDEAFAEVAGLRNRW